MTQEECKYCAYCCTINGELNCVFKGFACSIEYINYCQKNEREED